MCVLFSSNLQGRLVVFCLVLLVGLWLVILWRCIFAPSGTSQVDPAKVVREETNSIGLAVPGESLKEVPNSGPQIGGYVEADETAGKNGERLVRSVRHWDSAVKSESPDSPDEVAGDSSPNGRLVQQPRSATSSLAEREDDSQTADSESDSSKVRKGERIVTETAKSSVPAGDAKSVSHQSNVATDDKVEAGARTELPAGGVSLETDSETAKQSTGSDVRTSESSPDTAVEADEAPKEDRVRRETAAVSEVKSEQIPSRSDAGTVHLVGGRPGSVPAADAIKVPSESPKSISAGSEVKLLPSRHSEALSDAHEPTKQTSGNLVEPGRTPRANSAVDAGGDANQSDSGSAEEKADEANSAEFRSPVPSAEQGESGEHAVPPGASNRQERKAKPESIQVVVPQHQAEDRSTVERERTRSGGVAERARVDTAKGASEKAQIVSEPQMNGEDNGESRRPSFILHKLPPGHRQSVAGIAEERFSSPGRWENAGSNTKTRGQPVHKFFRQQTERLD